MGTRYSAACQYLTAFNICIASTSTSSILHHTRSNGMTNKCYLPLYKLQFGGLFPGPSKTTRAYLHKEEAVVAALKAAGFELQRTEVSFIA
jgi:Magnesium-protoporphyrin IX methyltransferase C-terminus